jgi:lipoprotein-releasing system ATP-binding protein
MSNTRSVLPRSFSQRPNFLSAAPPREVLSRMPHLATVNLQKSFRRGKSSVPVLKGVDLEIETGKFTAIVGKSGSGKSTLLHLLGTLDTADEGEVWFEDERMDQWSMRRKDQFRNSLVGMIFQFYHLLPELTMLENVLVPRMIQFGLLSYWRRSSKNVERARELLDLVGLSHRIHHKPNQLSGGEMQRTAIARALISDPKLLLADEPTGNLDSESGREVIDTLLKLKQLTEITIVMVTHDENIAGIADRLVTLVDGRAQICR